MTERTVPAAPVLPDSPDRKRIAGICGHWLGPEHRWCVSTDRVRHTISGYRCAEHRTGETAAADVTRTAVAILAAGLSSDRCPGCSRPATNHAADGRQLHYGSCEFRTAPDA